MSNELKNCPFCGGKPEFYYPFHLMGKPGSAAKYHAGVRCPQCRCESRATTPPDEAIAAWNTRTEQRMSDAARDVLAERARQVNEEGFTPDRDDAYELGTLATAAGCYGIWGWGDSGVYSTPGDDPKPWPWPRQWWKPSTLRRHCVKGAALYLAEIERIDRADRKSEIESQGGEA